MQCMRGYARRKGACSEPCPIEGCSVDCIANGNRNSTNDNDYYTCMWCDGGRNVIETWVSAVCANVPICGLVVSNFGMALRERYDILNRDSSLCGCEQHYYSWYCLA